MHSREIVSVVTSEPAAIDALLCNSGLRLKFYSGFNSFLQAHEPEFILCAMIDMQTPNLSVCDLLAGKTCETPIMILSDADCSVALRARAFGLADHVAKPLTRPSLLNAIERVRATRRLDPGAIDVAYQYRQQLYARLTNREREVMHLAINGHPNKEIGYRLGISQRTVEVHRARMMRKLNVRNLAQLVRVCIENDWS